jgi:hypothetical protein
MKGQLKGTGRTNLKRIEKNKWKRKEKAPTIKITYANIFQLQCFLLYKEAFPLRRTVVLIALIAKYKKMTRSHNNTILGACGRQAGRRQLCIFFKLPNCNEEHPKEGTYEESEADISAHSKAGPNSQT